MVNPKRQTTGADAAIDADADEWENIPTGGLGEEWDFEQSGTLIGNYLGSRDVETPKVESGKATAHQIAPHDAPDTIVFVWESAELAGAFKVGDDGTSLIRVGDRIRITFLGRRNFVGADGKPRQIKQFKIDAAKRK